MSNGDDSHGTIVVGVDGSESSRQALAWAAGQAALTGASLTAVMAWRWPSVWGRTPTWPPGWDPDEETLKQLAETVRSVLGDEKSVDVRMVVHEGHAESILLEAADGADLLVVGRGGHGDVVGMLFGSVSQYCATHARCPVTLVGGVTAR